MASSLQAKRVAFEQSKRIYESVLLTFKGVDGWDVYNCSVPFTFAGTRYIFGRVERRAEWATSHVRLFKNAAEGSDTYTAVPNIVFELEDPYIAKIYSRDHATADPEANPSARLQGEMVFGGTHVQKSAGDISTYFGYFYRSHNPFELKYFTTGPDYMKDIRLVQLKDGRVGVFSRPREGNVASIGFTIIDDLDQLTAEVITKAPALPVLEEGTWGGVNQAYLLSSGKVGCIGHCSYEDFRHGRERDPCLVYLNNAFVLDPATRKLDNWRIIGSRTCFPAADAKRPNLVDCAFTSGIVMRADGKCDLYSGLGDAHEGRITIDYPFEGHGEIVGDFNFFPQAAL